MAHEVHGTQTRRSTLGYAIVLLSAALFVTSCFLPYYGFGEGSFSLYDQFSLSVPQEGGLELGTILFLFGGVATVVVVAIVGLTRSERPSGRAFLAGAVAAWSLTWIGSLLQTTTVREEILPEGLSLVGGFWLQAVSIGVAVIGTILIAARRAGAHERHGDLSTLMRPHEVDRRLRQRLDAVACSTRRTAPRPHAARLEGAERIGEFWSYPQSRTFAELLIDCEEDRTLRAVLVGMLREMEL